MERIIFDKALRRSTLLAGMDSTSCDAIVPRFAAFSFEAGEPIIRAGDDGRHLGVVIHGEAVVQARRNSQAFTLERLGPGRVFGEIAFFDVHSPRTADVVGTAAGTAALLPFDVYAELVQAGHPAAAVIEKNVLDLLGRRIQVTNDKLAELLEANRQGTFLDKLRAFFGGR